MDPRDKPDKPEDDTYLFCWRLGINTKKERERRR